MWRGCRSRTGDASRRRGLRAESADATCIKQSFRSRLLAAGALRLGIFGSVARGEETEASDVDVLIAFRPDARTYDNLFAVGEILEEAFARRVDLVTHDALSPYLRPHIEAEAKYVDLAA